MPKIEGMDKISLITEPLPKKIENRDPTFSERIKRAVGDVNTKQHEADSAAQGIIKGEIGLHEGLMTMGKADVSLRLLSQVRGKAMAAYKEIIRMQV